jgi:hypothetical protein
MTSLDILTGCTAPAGASPALLLQMAGRYHMPHAESGLRSNGLHLSLRISSAQDYLIAERVHTLDVRNCRHSFQKKIKPHVSSFLHNCRLGLSRHPMYSIDWSICCVTIHDRPASDGRTAEFHPQSESPWYFILCISCFHAFELCRVSTGLDLIIDVIILSHFKLLFIVNRQRLGITYPSFVFILPAEIGSSSSKTILIISRNNRVQDVWFSICSSRPIYIDSPRHQWAAIPQIFMSINQFSPPQNPHEAQSLERKHNSHYWPIDPQPKFWLWDPKRRIVSPSIDNIDLHSPPLTSTFVNFSNPPAWSIRPVCISAPSKQNLI